MSDLSWVHSGEVVALGWTLLHFCWQSAVIALLYALADRCLLRARTVVRYGVAIAMLGLLPVAAIATFIEQEQLVIHFAQGAQPVVASQIGSLHASVVKEAPFAAPAMADTELWIAGHADRLMPWIDGVWLVGVCLLALRAAGGWRRLRSLRRNAQLTIPPAIQKSFAKLIAQLHLVHPVTLRVSAEVISPMAMGIWRTSVILPLSVATSLPMEQLEAVLAHELAHIGRWDYFCNLVQTAIECLFFFHPAVWWMSRRTRELREMCCDEIAARTCADPGIYAEALLKDGGAEGRALTTGCCFARKGRSTVATDTESDGRADDGAEINEWRKDCGGWTRLGGTGGSTPCSKRAQDGADRGPHRCRSERHDCRSWRIRVRA